MNQKSSKKNYVILSLSLILAIVIMAIGYARLSGVLAINNSKSIPGEWDIRIISAEENEKYGSFEKLTIKFSRRGYCNFKIWQKGKKIRKN